jgi:DHA3 family tetracycline resistance protein-like MFS transporter
MGTVLIFSSIPMLIFLLVGGEATERFPLFKIMLVSDFFNGVIVTLVNLLAFLGQLDIWHIYIASIFFGMMSAFFHPAYTATIPEITPTELLPSANSLTSLTQRATSAIGPSIGASIVAFGLDAPSLTISAGCILVILWTSSKLASSPASSNSTPEPVVSDPPTGNLGSALKNLKEGYLAVSHLPGWGSQSLSSVS